MPPTQNYTYPPFSIDFPLPYGPVHGMPRGVGSYSSGIANVSPALPLAGREEEFYHRRMGIEIYRG